MRREERRFLSSDSAIARPSSRTQIDVSRRDASTSPVIHSSEFETENVFVVFGAFRHLIRILDANRSQNNLTCVICTTVTLGAFDSSADRVLNWAAASTANLGRFVVASSACSGRVEPRRPSSPPRIRPSITTCHDPANYPAYEIGNAVMVKNVVLFFTWSRLRMRQGVPLKADWNFRDSKRAIRPRVDAVNRRICKTSSKPRATKCWESGTACDD